jgi:hypothetical protein
VSDYYFGPQTTPIVLEGDVFHDAFRVVVWPFPVLLVVPCEDVENWLTDG